MKANESVILSSKYQVVIPLNARKKLGITKAEGQRFRVERVTSEEIVFRKARTLDDFFGKYGHAFPEDPTAELRRMRDTEWD